MRISAWKRFHHHFVAHCFTWPVADTIGGEEAGEPLSERKQLTV